MRRFAAAVFFLAAACAFARTEGGLGVFANGEELTKVHPGAVFAGGRVHFDSDRDVFVAKSQIDKETGLPELTLGYHLPAKHVIHTVGPVYRDGRHGEPEALASCYRRCLELALGAGLHSVAFPCISTGVYGYPPDEAAKIAVATVRAFLDANPAADLSVTFCCFSRSDLARYEKELQTQSAIDTTWMPA